MGQEAKSCFHRQEVEVSLDDTNQINNFDTPEEILKDTEVGQKTKIVYRCLIASNSIGKISLCRYPDLNEVECPVATPPKEF